MDVGSSQNRHPPKSQNLRKNSYLAVRGEGGLQQPWHTNFPLWIFTPKNARSVPKNPPSWRSETTNLPGDSKLPKKIKHQNSWLSRKPQNLKIFFWCQKHQTSKLPQHAVKPLSSKKPPMKFLPSSRAFRRASRSKTESMGFIALPPFSSSTWRFGAEKHL